MGPDDDAAGPAATGASPGRTAAEVEAEWRAATIPVLRSRPVLMVRPAEPDTVREETLLDEDGHVIGSAKWRVLPDGLGPVWCEVTDGAAVKRLLDATKVGHARRVADGTAEPMRVYKIDDDGRVVAVGDLEACDG